MFLASTAKHIFYSAGKCGTSTITNLPDIKNHHISLNNLRRESKLRCAQIVNSCPHKQLVFVIRHPWDRLVSGLHQVICKRIFSWPCEYLLDHNLTTIESMQNMLYDVAFWEKTIQNYMSLTPIFWNKNRDFSAPRVQYHYGNWLGDVVYLQENYNHTVVLTDQLSNFLIYHYGETSVLNPKRVMFDHNKYPEINGQLVFDSFLLGLKDYISDLEQYIQNEVTYYHKILAFQQPIRK